MAENPNWPSVPANERPKPVVPPRPGGAVEVPGNRPLGDFSDELEKDFSVSIGLTPNEARWLVNNIFMPRYEQLPLFLAATMQSLVDPKINRQTFDYPDVVSYEMLGRVLNLDRVSGVFMFGGSSRRDSRRVPFAWKADITQSFGLGENLKHLNLRLMEVSDLATGAIAPIDFYAGLTSALGSYDIATKPKGLAAFKSNAVPKAFRRDGKNKFEDLSFGYMVFVPRVDKIAADYGVKGYLLVIDSHGGKEICFKRIPVGYTNYDWYAGESYSSKEARLKIVRVKASQVEGKSSVMQYAVVEKAITELIGVNPEMQEYLRERLGFRASGLDLQIGG